MIEDIIFETKGSNQCEIKLQHSTGETTTLLFNSTFPLQAQEYYLKAIQLLQQEKPDLSPKMICLVYLLCGLFKIHWKCRWG